MIRRRPCNRPAGRAGSRRIGTAMDLVLHVGAHRCATTSFQHYLRMNAAALRAQGTGHWGPRRTRSGLLRGILPVPGPATGRDLRQRAIGRLRLNLEEAAAEGVTTLIVSDENLLGALRENLRLADLYCGLSERMARYHQAFGGAVSDVMLNIRALDAYWRSALVHGVMRGRPVPGPQMMDRLAASPRSWRDVVTDLAGALPGARIHVLPFEEFAGRPEAQLAAVTGRRAPLAHARSWLGATPRLPELRASVGRVEAARLPEGEDRWQPFDAAQIAALREAYADDLMWLAAGADGLARLVDDPDNTRAGPNPPMTEMTRGRCDDHQEGRLARAG